MTKNVHAYNAYGTVEFWVERTGGSALPFDNILYLDLRYYDGIDYFESAAGFKLTQDGIILAKDSTGIYQDTGFVFDPTDGARHILTIEANIDGTLSYYYQGNLIWAGLAEYPDGFAGYTAGSTAYIGSGTIDSTWSLKELRSSLTPNDPWTPADLSIDFHSFSNGLVDGQNGWKGNGLGTIRSSASGGKELYVPLGGIASKEFSTQPAHSGLEVAVIKNAAPTDPTYDQIFEINLWNYCFLVAKLEIRTDGSVFVWDDNGFHDTGYDVIDPYFGVDWLGFVTHDDGTVDYYYQREHVWSGPSAASSAGFSRVTFRSVPAGGLPDTEFMVYEMYHATFNILANNEAAWNAEGFRNVESFVPLVIANPAGPYEWSGIVEADGFDLYPDPRKTESGGAGGVMSKFSTDVFYITLSGTPASEFSMIIDFDQAVATAGFKLGGPFHLGARKFVIAKDINGNVIESRSFWGSSSSNQSDPLFISVNATDAGIKSIELQTNIASGAAYPPSLHDYVGWALLHDFTGDGFVDGADLGLLLAGWGEPGLTDINRDNVTNGADLGLLLGAWGSYP
ncbi:MAG: hypothetical protein ACYTF7_02130 [Planctomycetota bacterium]|jgi:hypothetical protein